MEETYPGDTRVISRSDVGIRPNEIQSTPLRLAVANRTALEEDTELEEYIVQMTGSPEIITKSNALQVSAIAEKISSLTLTWYRLLTSTVLSIPSSVQNGESQPLANVSVLSSPPTSTRRYSSPNGACYILDHFEGFTS